MKVRNKRNGTNTLAYRSGASVLKAIIPGGSVVDLVNLTSLEQVVNQQDFKNGWFEILKDEVKKIEEKVEESIEIITEEKEDIKLKDNILEKAKKEATQYLIEEKKNSKNKKNKIIK